MRWQRWHCHSHARGSLGGGGPLAEMFSFLARDEKDLVGVKGGVTGICGEIGTASIASRLLRNGVVVMVSVLDILALLSSRA